MLRIKALPTDISFFQSHDAGDPRCLCSRCLLPIAEETVPIRLVGNDRQGVFELRYHPICLGFERNN